MNSTENLKKMLSSPSYRLAYQDSDFLSHEVLRPVRLQLELQKPDMIMDMHSIQSTVVVFGSARLVDEKDARKRMAAVEKKLARHPKSAQLRKQLAIAKQLLKNAHYYEQAQEFSRIVSTTCQIDGICDFVIVTGGGPGIMEAANKGAFEARAKSVGLNIALPHEDVPNRYITPELCFQFQYFAIRKMHFLLRAKALVAFPGGFGTLDELFETLTLVQTKRMEPLPIILFGESHWKKLIDFDFLVSQGMVSDEDLALCDFAETAEEAWQKIVAFYKSRGQWPHHLKEDDGKYQLYVNSDKPADD